MVMATSQAIEVSKKEK